MELFKKMISMQHDLNIATNGLNYAVTTAHEMTGKKINWNRTAWTGAARFIETLGWKHWEHSKDDLDRAKVVLSDIWHSLMSGQLTRHAFLSGEVDDQTIESVASDAYLAFASRWENSKMDENHLDKTDRFVASLLSNDENCFEAQRLFWEICDVIGLGLKELSQIVTTKNLLYRFRNENGYGTGDYKKVWWWMSPTGQSIEVGDEIVAQDIAKTIRGHEQFEERLYETLTTVYKINCN